MLSRVNVTPEVRAAMNDNADIPKAALARLERDQAYSNQWGATREDIQNARRIIGEGKGWVDRLEAAMKAGVILPAWGLRFWGIVPGIVLRRPSRLRNDRSASMRDLHHPMRDAAVEFFFLRLGIGGSCQTPPSSATFLTMLESPSLTHPKTMHPPIFGRPK